MNDDNNVEQKMNADLALGKLQKRERLLSQAKKGQMGFTFWSSLIVGIFMIFSGIWSKDSANNLDVIFIGLGFSLLVGLSNSRTNSRLDALLELLETEDPHFKT